MIQEGKIDPLKMVTHRVRLEEIDKVYYKFDAKEDRMQKVFISTQYSAPPCAGAPELTVYEKGGLEALKDQNVRSMSISV